MNKTCENIAYSDLNDKMVAISLSRIVFDTDFNGISQLYWSQNITEFSFNLKANKKLK